ncbi:MAG TPA: hypothetical protein VJ825_06480 [Gemmatimonadaceae bacterium]|nr:hypothetical protein [Gemmatimonadaceae bacterium]
MSGFWRLAERHRWPSAVIQLRERLYAVNGHNRLALARRTGHQSVNVQEINARTAGEARAQGALANIAEGRGTATDAANFFRETGLSTEQLRDRVSFKGVIAKRGMAMSKLAPDIFAKVESGKLPEGTAAAIGEVLPDSPEMQRTAVGALERSRARLSEAEARELARQIRDAGSERTTQESLFGKEDSELPIWIEQSKLTVAIQKKLAQDRRLFGYVSREGRAEGLARGGNVIDVEKSQQIANESAQLEELFNTLSGRSGPLADMLRQATRRIVNGEKQADIINELYPAIKEAVSQALTGSPAPSGGASGVGDQNGQSETGYDATGRQVGRIEEEGRALDTTDPNQSALLSPEHFNPGELREPRSPYEHALDALWREQGRNGRAALLKRWSELYPEQKWLPGWADLNIEDLPAHVREKIGMERVNQTVALEDVLRPKKGDEGVNYSPGERARQSEPERLATFAMKAPDGTIIEGRDIHDAWMRASRAGYDIDEITPGFTTNTGRFLPEGREAVMLAYEAGQLKRNTQLYKALSQGALPFDVGGRWSLDSKVRSVGGKGAEIGEPPRPIIAARIDERGALPFDTNPSRARYLQNQARKAGYPSDYNNPEGGPAIVGRAIRYADENGKPAVEEVEKFSDTGKWVETEPNGEEKPFVATEGYLLDNGDFITREEAEAMFPDADFGPEGRDASGPLFSPDREYSPDNPFVLRGEDAGQQESLFGGNEGTAASRNLSQSERHAQSEVARLRQLLGLETDPRRRTSLASEIAQHEKLLNRGKAISAEEMEARAIAAEGEKNAPHPGPDQGVLLAPASQPTSFGFKIRRALGIKNSNVGDVIALRKISIGLARLLASRFERGAAISSG